MALGRFSIRVRLILIVGTILVIGFLTTNLISFQVSRETLRSTILHNELPLTSSNIYSEIQADLLRPVFVSSLMSNDTFVKDWLESGELDITKIQRYLGTIRERYDVFTTFLISEKSKNYYHPSGIQQVVSEADPDDQWYFRARAMQPLYEINIDNNQDEKKTLTIFVNYKVIDDKGGVMGIIGVGLNVDAVARIVSRYRDNYRRNIYFIDREGKITVRSDNATLTEKSIRDAEGIKDIADKMLASKEGYFEYRRNGENMLITTRYVPDLHWYIVVEQKESVALANLWSGFLTNLAIGATIVLLTMLAIGYAINLYQRRLEILASTDKLTGIGNRQMFDFSLQKALADLQRSHRQFSVLLLDIDHFKRINDQLGHLTGDQVIRNLADTVKQAMRESDVLCRWGGEELIVLAFDCDLTKALTLAEKLRLAVADHQALPSHPALRVTMSLGVATARADDSPETLVGRADAALYRAKDAGRNCVRVEEN